MCKLILGSLEDVKLDATHSVPTATSANGQGQYTVQYTGSPKMFYASTNYVATGAVQIIDKCPPSVNIEGLRHDSVEIEREFAVIVASTYHSLKTRNISVEELKACLMGFNCLTKVYDGSDQSMFRKQRRNFDDPSTTVTKVWNIIGDYISFFDYDILELIANTLGTDQDRQNIIEYKQMFKVYVSQRLFIEIPLGNSPCPKEGSTLLFVMLDSTYDDCEIGRLKRLQAKLSKILNLNNGVLLLRKVRKGSLQLVFQIPDFIPSDIFPLSSDQESALRELGVTQLNCGEYHFRAKV